MALDRAKRALNAEAYHIELERAEKALNVEAYHNRVAREVGYWNGEALQVVFGAEAIKGRPLQNSFP